MPDVDVRLAKRAREEVLCELDYPSIRGLKGTNCSWRRISQIEAMANEEPRARLADPPATPSTAASVWRPIRNRWVKKVDVSVNISGRLVGAYTDVRCTGTSFS